MDLFRWLKPSKPRQDGRLEHIESLLATLVQKETQSMALGQDILDKVTEVETKVGSFIALIEALIADSTIPAEVGVAILNKLQGTEAELDAAIAANTPPTP